MAVVRIRAAPRKMAMNHAVPLVNCLVATAIMAKAIR
jgi:hypothetical protein